MQKILMILTHNRRDLLGVNLRMHERAGSYDVFDRVVFLLNGVSPQHMAYVDAYIQSHPGVAFDKIEGDGTRPRGISDMQNRCIEKYPGSYYVKTDEDVFVPNHWAKRMVEAYEANQSVNNLALITPLIPNNAYGLYVLLTEHYPDLLEDYRQRFHHDPSDEPQGPTWQRPDIGEWASRCFLDINKANQKHRDLLRDQQKPDYTQFCKYFSVGCIGYDHEHIKRMGGIPWNDEPGWCKWFEEHGHPCILDHRQIVLHYTFFVQQEWLDRSTLLEDIRRVNLGERPSPMDRWSRIAQQIPSVVKRKLGR
ncbi:MAG: hypothetical protein KDL31_12400 [Kiritimatiellae bacterium]|nr:hypothetical protein [Kiritimatiellia bacterium]